MKTFFLTFLLSATLVAQDYYDADYDKLIQKAETVATEDGQRVLVTGRIMTLDSALILPGSCWDYANAVYERAGYSWGGRQEVFKSVKAGPYADLNLVKNGDWLYYVNYSYGEIEHSAIFVEWLDRQKKIGLMLSYGGESRHEPARYLPYDLKSVYGITRPKSGSSATSSVVKPKTEIKTNATTSAATSTTATTAIDEVSGVVSAGMKVDAFKFGTGIASMEITGEGLSFSGNTGRVYCWMRVSGGQGRSITIKWFHNGNAVGETKLDLKYASMRTYAYRTVTHRSGKWSVQVLDPSNTVLHAASFTVE